MSGYANTLLTAAKSLYAFAKNHKGIYSQSVSQASNFYGYVSYRITEQRRIQDFWESGSYVKRLGGVVALLIVSHFSKIFNGNEIIWSH